MTAHTLTSLSSWMPLPSHVTGMLAGKSKLPIHELDKTKVQTPHARVRPFPAASGNLTFNAWRLAHAVKKADCLRQPFGPHLWVGAAGFLLENGHLFDWSKGHFALHDGTANHYADFTSSGLAGRIGQGMAILFLEQQGYAYVGRFETEWKQRAAAQNKSWPAGKQKAPDFIAEDQSQDWILAESKAGFSGPNSKPNIKGALNQGLEQLEGWDKHISPQPKKSLAIGTFLRESSDCSDETSMIAFVDPEPEAPEDPVTFPTDTVRRANYAGWLSAMGFEDAAYRLRTEGGGPQRRRAPVVAVGGRKFMVRVASISAKHSDLSSSDFWDDLWGWRHFPFLWPKDSIRVGIIGLDLNVVRVLESALDGASPDRTIKSRPQEMSDYVVDRDVGDFDGSIFSDGSLLGELRFTRSSKPTPDFEWIEVDL